MWGVGNISEPNESWCSVLKQIYKHIENRVQQYMDEKEQDTRGFNPHFVRACLGENK